MKPRVCLFFKAPLAGFVKTRLAASLGEGEALEVYRLLAERQLASIPEGWEIEIHYTPATAGSLMADWLGSHLRYVVQGEGDLGARLEKASAESFRRPTPAVFFLGGDCPYADQAVLLHAFESLQQHEVVVGPAVDGGYYLLGLTQHRPTLFRGIPWSTEQVWPQTESILRQEGLTYAVLNTLEDVDDLPSWTRAQDYLKNQLRRQGAEKDHGPGGPFQELQKGKSDDRPSEVVGTMDGLAGDGIVERGQENADHARIGSA
jgi:uncharacterized protein